MIDLKDYTEAGMDIGAFMKLKKGWEVFSANHPKFPNFVAAMKGRGIHEGDVVAISIIGPDGNKVETNIKVTESDMILFENLRDL